MGVSAGEGGWSRSPGADGYVHDALFFATPSELVSVTGPWLRDGVEAGDDLVLLCRDDLVSPLSAAAGRGARLTVVPPAEVWRKALDAVGFLRDLVESRSREGVRVRLLADVACDESPRALQEWRRFEALHTHSVGDLSLWAVCGYDTERLPEACLETGRQTHRHLLDTTGSRTANPEAVDPVVVLESVSSAVTLPTGPPLATVSGLRDLRHLRNVLRHELGGAVPATVVDDLLVVANELARNGIEHGAPPVEVRVTVTDGEVSCAVTDHGHGIRDPFAGYLPPRHTRGGRRHSGLWVARYLSDDLHHGFTPEGFTVAFTLKA
ncbi:sensor histidine kinase [Phycicoccus sp. SLBN-51]|uniref:sensor histidine kinase n=1 Tax=Phycicoccus sp. SLBN-51 TaxID=2768447 RepID=UPI00116F5261|nr:sensor histidine kinase [Phycicoccus sp. SLBN-51]TQJ48896.1 histidine kinase-like protein [Phycicoccus sp. SLBN-51]